MKTKCSECSERSEVENPAEGTNLVTRRERQTATLPDGREMDVEVDVEVAADTVRWECPKCGKVQEAKV